MYVLCFPCWTCSFYTELGNRVCSVHEASRCQSCLVVLCCLSVTDKFSTEAWLPVRRVHHSRKGMMSMEVGAGCVFTDQETEGEGYTPPKTQARYHLQGLSDPFTVSRSGVLRVPPPPWPAAPQRVSVQMGAFGGCFKFNSHSCILQIVCHAS